MAIVSLHPEQGISHQTAIAHLITTFLPNSFEEIKTHFKLYVAFLILGET